MNYDLTEGNIESIRDDLRNILNSSHSGGGGGTSDLSDYAKKDNIADFDNIKDRSSKPTASDFTNKNDIFRVDDKLYFKDNSNNVIEVGSSDDNDDAEKWKASTEYTSDELFSFKTSLTTATFKDGTKIEPNKIYIAHYDANTTSSNSLTKTEIAKMLSVSGSGVSDGIIVGYGDSFNVDAKDAEDNYFILTKSIDSFDKGIYKSDGANWLFTAGLFDNADYWKPNFKYNSNQMFTVRVGMSDGEFSDSMTVVPNKLYLAHYDNDTLSSSSLSVDELSKMSTVLSDKGIISNHGGNLPAPDQIKEHKNKYFVLGRKTGKTYKGIYYSDGDNLLPALTDMSNGDPWVAGTFYPRDQLFTFSTNATDAVFADGGEVEAGKVYLAHYMAKEKSGGVVDTAEIAKMLPLGGLIANKTLSNKNKIYFSNLEGNNKTYTLPATPNDVVLGYNFWYKTTDSGHVHTFVSRKLLDSLGSVTFSVTGKNNLNSGAEAETFIASGMIRANSDGTCTVYNKMMGALDKDNNYHSKNSTSRLEYIEKIIASDAFALPADQTEKIVNKSAEVDPFDFHGSTNTECYLFDSFLPRRKATGVADFRMRLHSYGDNDTYSLGGGINNKSFASAEVTRLSTVNDIDMNNKSFAFSFWVKLTQKKPNDETSYMLGTYHDGNGVNKETLHVGYRLNDTFTIAFWSSDVNFTVDNKYKRANQIGKWLHVGVIHDPNSLNTTLVLNGNKIGTLTHPDGFIGKWDSVNGARGVYDGAMIFSNLRVFVANKSVGAILGSSKMKELYEMEYKNLIDD